MRFKSTAIAIVLLAASPASAQQVMQQQQGGQVYTPLYNTNSAAPMYYTQTANGGAPVYNNIPNTPALPLNQMIAGKNAPSYVSRQRPYGTGNQGNWYTGAGAMSPDQEAEMQRRIQANQQQYAQQQALAQQQQYMNTLQNTQQQQNIQQMSQYGVPNLGMLQGGPYAAQQQMPVKRKVVYKEMNNPLREPQRLFNPDQ